MGKKTDRMYITMKEWTSDFGGRKANAGPVSEGAGFAPLPFYCCSLSLQPFEDPVCTKDGVVYDVTNIIPWLKKYKVDPITGKSITADDLFTLHWHKNDAGKYCCPVTYKEFTEFSHIVALRTSGHVYSWEAIDELCLKAKNMKCLLTETPFTKEDIVTIQDPNNLERRNLSNFHHVKLGIKPEDWAAVDPKKDIHIPERTKKLLNQMTAKFDEEQKKKKDEEKNMVSAPRYDKYTEVPAQAPSFTSSSYSNKTVKVDARSIAIHVDKKGYVRIHTTHGDLNVELHCDMVPKTCENFLGLCDQHYYDNTEFHRLIKGFMIQGGDPTGTGRGGKSIWGKPFQDEFTPRLQHHGRGILSMANSGKDTNNSQFFITFSACHHLNNKHSIFGRVVGGNETLGKMEQIPVDKDDRPLEPIKILKITVFVDPFKELDNEEEKKKKEEEQKAKEKAENQKGLWYSAPAQDTLPKTSKTGVGKYIGTDAPAPKVNKRAPIAPAAQDSRPAKKKQGFGDFSNW